MGNKEGGLGNILIVMIQTLNLYSDSARNQANNPPLNSLPNLASLRRRAVEIRFTVLRKWLRKGS